MDQFLIFGLERSGTTSLAAALNVNDSVVQEPFHSNSGDIGSNSKFTAVLEESGYLEQDLPEPRPGDFAFNRFHFIGQDVERCGAYLVRLYEHFTGVKHVWNTVSIKANLNILKWCEESGMKVIFQFRENLARSLISNYLAQQAQIWQLGTWLEHREDWLAARFEPIDIDRLQREVERREGEVRFYRDCLRDKPHFTVVYEAFFGSDHEGRERALRTLCQFLSVRYEDLDMRNLQHWIFMPDRKQTPDEVLRRIPNYSDLREFL